MLVEPTTGKRLLGYRPSRWKYLPEEVQQGKVDSRTNAWERLQVFFLFLNFVLGLATVLPYGALNTRRHGQIPKMPY